MAASFETHEIVRSKPLSTGRDLGWRDRIKSWATGLGGRGSTAGRAMTNAPLRTAIVCLWLLTICAAILSVVVWNELLHDLP